MSRSASLGEFVSITRGTTYKSALLGQSGPVLLGLASIARNGGFRSDSLRTYGGDSPEKLLVRPGQLFASLKDVTQAADLLGSVARVPKNGSVGRLTQDTVRLDLTSSEIDPDYLYWTLLTPQYRSYCRSHATGTTNLGLPRDDFLGYEFPLPGLSEQRRIAAVLSSLDDLIERNRQTIAAFRTLAVASLDAASGDGGEVVPFFVIATQVRDGVARSGLGSGTPYLGLEHFGQDGEGIIGVGDASSVSSNKTRFRSGDVLYGKLRPYFRKHDRPGFDGVCTTEVWVLRPNEGWGAATLSAVVSRPEFTEFAMAGSGGTKMPRANWEHVSTMPVSVPAPSVRRILDERLEVLWSAQGALTNEISDLSRTRDELLPLLMSGAIRVNEALEVSA